MCACACVRASKCSYVLVLFTTPNFRYSSAGVVHSTSVHLAIVALCTHGCEQKHGTLIILFYDSDIRENRLVS